MCKEEGCGENVVTPAIFRAYMPDGLLAINNRKRLYIHDNLVVWLVRKDVIPLRLRSAIKEIMLWGALLSNCFDAFLLIAVHDPNIEYEWDDMVSKSTH